MEPVRTLHLAPTGGRTAEPGRFETAFQGAVAGATRGVTGTLALAAPVVPGGAVLAGAIHGATSASAATASRGATSSAAVAAGGGDLLDATRSLQLEAQSFNLQYLQLQESLQRESREFQAVSNVMKVRHDAAKSAIHNIQ
jgi:hypothetical protein